MAIKGPQKSSVSLEDVLKHTNGGWDVFSSEIKGLKVGKAFKSPLRNDRSPSMSILCKDGVWMLKDFSTGDVYTSVTFVQKKYGLSFKDALNKMAMEAGMMKEKERIYEVQEMPIYIPSLEEMMPITYFKGSWGKKAKDFWRNTGVTEDHCIKHNTFLVQEAAVKHQKEYIGKNELVWAYDAGMGRIKLYFPERPKGERFKNNIKGSHLWNFENIRKCNALLVQKSMKDLLVTSLLFPCVIATQAEESNLFNAEIVEDIHKLTDTVYVSYGSDEQGVREGTKLSQKYGWKHVNPQKKHLPDINDFYGMAKKYGLSSIEKLLKSKKIL